MHVVVGVRVASASIVHVVAGVRVATHVATIVTNAAIVVAVSACALRLTLILCAL